MRDFELPEDWDEWSEQEQEDWLEDMGHYQYNSEPEICGGER